MVNKLWHDLVYQNQKFVGWLTLILKIFVFFTNLTCEGTQVTVTPLYKVLLRAKKRIFQSIWFIILSGDHSYDGDNFSEFFLYTYDKKMCL